MLGVLAVQGFEETLGELAIIAWGHVESVGCGLDTLAARDHDGISAKAQREGIIGFAVGDGLVARDAQDRLGQWSGG